jgi:peptidoglycan/xylan/chitin deacetylase (PgdA/CDA1 family)
VPATVFERYQPFFEKLQNDAEFAVHGLIHKDYSLMDAATVKDHLEKSLSIFKAYGISKPGFRAPYLRFNDKHISLLEQGGYAYDASLSIHYDIVKKKNKVYDKALENYSPVVKAPKSDFPRYPVSLPDDEMLIDRLGCTDFKALSKLFVSTMELAIASDRFFALQLHPERFQIAKESLSDLLKTAKNCPYPILPLSKAKKECICITGDIDALSLNDFRSK